MTAIYGPQGRLHRLLLEALKLAESHAYPGMHGDPFYRRCCNASLAGTTILSTITEEPNFEAIEAESRECLVILMERNDDPQMATHWAVRLGMDSADPEQRMGSKAYALYRRIKTALEQTAPGATSEWL